MYTEYGSPYFGKDNINGESMASINDRNAESSFYPKGSSVLGFTFFRKLFGGADVLE